MMMIMPARDNINDRANDAKSDIINYVDIMAHGLLFK